MSLLYVKQINNHTKAIKQCVLLIENIKILIEYKNLSVKEIFEEISNTNSYNMLVFLDNIKNGVNEYHQTLNNVFSKENSLNMFDLDDIEHLKGFFSMLGKSDTSGQILNCNLYKNLFEKKYLQLEENKNLKCKSTATITLGIGLLFSIIVI